MPNNFDDCPTFPSKSIISYVPNILFHPSILFTVGCLTTTMLRRLFQCPSDRSFHHNQKTASSLSQRLGVRSACSMFTGRRDTIHIHIAVCLSARSNCLRGSWYTCCVLYVSVCSALVYHRHCSPSPLSPDSLPTPYSPSSPSPFPLPLSSLLLSPSSSSPSISPPLTRWKWRDPPGI